MDTLIHDFIMGRAEGSDPKHDLIQLGYNADAIYEGVCLNDDLTMGLFASGADPIPQRALANYAMAFFTIGVCIERERNVRENSNDFPPTAGE
jgi:hypothetical protein